MTQKIDSRPKSLSFMMLVPAVFALLMVVAYGAVMYMMSQGRSAEGRWVTMSFSGECLSKAKPIIEQRMSAMGLGEPSLTLVNGKLEAKAQLPGFREKEEEHIPKILAQQGLWQMRYDGNILLSNEDIKNVKYGEDESGYLEVLLDFHKEKRDEVGELLAKEPEKQTEIWLDDQLIIHRPNTVIMSDDFRFVSEETDPAKKSLEAANFLILLSNAMIPCQLELGSVVVLDDQEKEK